VGAVLISDWMHGLPWLDVRDEASVSVVREQVRERALALGLEEARAAELVTAASELAHNQLRYAKNGEIALREVARQGVAGLEVVAADAGNGIMDPERALSGKMQSQGLGVGLSSVLRLCDEVDFDVRYQQGTCVRARRFAGTIRAYQQVGVVGRPHPDESASGDDALVLREADHTLVAVADGLGHGPLARAASRAAMAEVRRHASLSPREILPHCHAALRTTRGAVMAVARIDVATRQVAHAGVGNILAQVHGPSGVRTLHSGSGVLGSPGVVPRVGTDETQLLHGEVLVLFTDGIQSRASFADRPHLLREHPLVVAHYVCTAFARNNDDALVVAVR
jgi:anti-sigma regulatory factor (Ser/Thr protein kinase)